MADEISNPNSAPVVANAAPVVNAPAGADAAAPVVTEPSAASTPAVNPPADSKPADSKPAAQPEIAPEEPVEKSLLGEEPKAEVKAEEKPKAEEKKSAEAEKPADVKDESKQSDEPAPLPTYEKFTLPENMTLDDTKLGEFTKILGDYELESKADHAATQKLGQKLLDKYITETQETFTRLQEHQKTQWEKIKSDWKESFIKDPDIGGNRQDTTLNSALEFIRTHGGNEDQQKEFRTLMNTTGVGNHPAMIRMMANAMQANREGKSVPAQKPAPTVTSKVVRRYGNNA